MDVTFEDVEQNIDEVTVPKGEDNLELIDTSYGMYTPAVNNRNNYKVDGGEEKKADGKLNIVFSEELGLAIEPPANGISID